MSTAIFAPSSTCILSVTPSLAGSTLHDCDPRRSVSGSGTSGAPPTETGPSALGGRVARSRL